MKPKQNHKPGTIDDCQTPGYAVDPIVPYLQGKLVWEPARGDGYMMEALARHCKTVYGTDIKGGFDFFERELEAKYNLIVTNPPYSLKYEWLERCYSLHKPFALLVPVEMLGSGKAQAMFREHGIEITLISPRVDFKMPNKGWGGSAQFPVCWISWWVTGEPLRIVRLNKPKRGASV